MVVSIAILHYDAVVRLTAALMRTHRLLPFDTYFPPFFLFFFGIFSLSFYCYLFFDSIFQWKFTRWYFHFYISLSSSLSRFFSKECYVVGIKYGEVSGVEFNSLIIWFFSICVLKNFIVLVRPSFQFSFPSLYASRIYFIKWNINNAVPIRRYSLILLLMVYFRNRNLHNWSVLN